MQKVNNIRNQLNNKNDVCMLFITKILGFFVGQNKYHLSPKMRLS